jgi:anti-sigma factor RsiW
MNCNEVRRHWELYHDSEGDSELYLAVNEHLAACLLCSEWYTQQSSLEDAIEAKLVAPQPTADLWDRVLQHAGLAEPVATRGWSFLGTALAVAATLLVSVGVWLVWPTAHPEHLSQFAADVHRQLTSGAAAIEFTSGSDEAVEAYLKNRVAFPVRCPPRKDAGFTVRGGGVCEIAGKPAAYVVGQVGGGAVSVFILPEEALAGFAHERDALRRDQFHHCREKECDMVLAKIDRNIVLVIGQGRPEQLEKVVRAYGTYPHGPVTKAAAVRRLAHLALTQSPAV